MVLPSLISLSLTPGPYWPAAKAVRLLASMSPPADRPAVTACFTFMASSLWSPFRSAARLKSLQQKPDRAGHAARHRVHQQQHPQPIDRPWGGVGNVVGEDGHEFAEKPTDNSA